MAILLEMILFHIVTHRMSWIHTASATAEEVRPLTLSLPEASAKSFGGDNKAYVMYLILQ